MHNYQLFNTVYDEQTIVCIKNKSIIFVELTKIMIINDSKAIQIFLEKIIDSFEDCKVVNCSSNGKLALISLKFRKPDIIILDLEMPQIDGLTFLEKIKGNYNIPVIVMSVYAKNGSAILEDVIKAGALDFIAPPDGNSDLEIKKFKTVLRSKIAKAKLARIETRV